MVLLVSDTSVFWFDLPPIRSASSTPSAVCKWHSEIFGVTPRIRRQPGTSGIYGYCAESRHFVFGGQRAFNPTKCPFVTATPRSLVLCILLHGQCQVMHKYSSRNAVRAPASGLEVVSRRVLHRKYDHVGEGPHRRTSVRSRGPVSGSGGQDGAVNAR